MRFTAGVPIWFEGMDSGFLSSRADTRVSCHSEPCFSGRRTWFYGLRIKNRSFGRWNSLQDDTPSVVLSEREGPGFTAFRIRPGSFGRWNSPQDDKTPGCRYRWAVLVCRPEQGEGPGHCHSEQSEGSGFKAPGITTRFFVASLLRMTGFGCHPEQREGPGFRPQDDREMWFFSIAGETLP